MYTWLICLYQFHVDIERNILALLHLKTKRKNKQTNKHTFLLHQVPLGSIPELPAESCKEIKASGGGKAVSGRYWIDSVVPGKVVLALCDMEREGKVLSLFPQFKSKLPAFMSNLAW